MFLNKLFKINKYFKKQNGFTLIEILITIIIIGILAAIVSAPMLRNARAKANDAKRKAHLHEIQNALENYHSDHNHYPNNETWKDDLTSPNPQYMTFVPIDPKREDYIYAPSPNLDAYELSAVLENKNDEDPSYNKETGLLTLTNKQL